MEVLTQIIPIEIKAESGETPYDLSKLTNHQSVAVYLKHLGRLPHETRQEGVNRRLEANHGNSYDSTILRIKTEVESELPSNFKDTFSSFSGSGWPSDIEACPDYNRGLCEINTSFHSDGNIHICAICKSLFNIGSFHTAISCDLFKRLDSGLVKSLDEQD